MVSSPDPKLVNCLIVAGGDHWEAISFTALLLTDFGNFNVFAGMLGKLNQSYSHRDDDRKEGISTMCKSRSSCADMKS